LRAWADCADTAQGAELISLRTALINDAASRLKGDDLSIFLKTLIERGDYMTYEVPIIAASQILFTDASETLQNKIALEWLSSVSNASARDKLAYNLGISYKGGDIGFVMSMLSDLKTKRTILDGYCASMARYRPCDAYRVYEANLPEGSDYSGLAMIAANMKTDFPDFLAMLPADERSLVSKAREQALKSWGRTDPFSAANYVRANSQKIQPGYIKSVMSTWVESDPVAAIEWARKETDPIYKVNSFRGIVEAWKVAEPYKAWNLIVTESGIDSNKDELLKMIHADWIKIDSDAAEAARASYENLLNKR
jgi:hypothetical protein